MTVIRGERPAFDKDQIKEMSERIPLSGKAHSAEEVYENCKDYMEQVVDMFYAAYSDYVEKSDLYSQACLTMMTAYSEGVFNNGKGRFTSFGKDLLVSLHSYCICEMETKTDSVHVRNQDLLLYMMQARSVQEYINENLISVIDRLPERQKEAVISYYYRNGENLSAVMRDLNLTRDMAFQALSYGLRKLRSVPNNRAELSELLSTIDSGVAAGGV